MKKLFTTLISSIALTILAVPIVLAQTPDGQTPAEETVCDPLKADGVSKGLYGLCVAFCEAQDHTDVSIPITEAELLLLEESAPSGRILENYNKKKTETDPAMPCILVEEPCPCWSASELASIGDALPGSCVQLVNPTTGLIDLGLVFATEGIIHQALADDRHRVSFTIEQCSFIDFREPPGIFREASVPAGTLTHEQAQVWLEQVTTRCAELGFEAT